MWNKTREHLGNVKSHSTNKISFIFEGDDKIHIDIKSIVSSCSCTSVTWNENSKTMEVTYVPRDVPVHIKSQLGRNYISDAKSVIFKQTINDKTSDQTFTILATVFDKLPQ